MTPRKAKPPAVPIEMPRTEHDLDRLMSAVEQHMAEGHKLGRLYSQRQLTSRQVLDRAAALDERLYNVLEDIQVERESVPSD